MLTPAPLGRLSGPYAHALLGTAALFRQRVVALTTVVLFAIAGTGTAASAQDLPDTMLPLQIDEVLVEDGQLIAVGSLGDTTFRSPVNLSLDQIIDDPDGDVCAILDLQIGAIHLDLLGLQVDTSDICLLVAAEEGEGNLLGNLLCGVAGLLDDGLALEDILAGLDPDTLDELLQGIADLLNGALAEATSPASVAGVSGTREGQGQGQGQGLGQGQGRGQGRGQGQGQGQGQGSNGRDCDILNLVVGPVELDLLGLQVLLDDCEGGPVTVDITAERGRGNLLGNLLCSLAGLLDDDPLDLDAIEDLLGRIADAIEDLI